MSDKGNFVFNQCAGVFQGQNDIIWDVGLHNDLILYSGSDNGRVVAWNAQTCQIIGSMQCQGTVTQIRALRRVLISAGDRVIVTEVLPTGMFSPAAFATVPVLNPMVPRGAPGCVIGTVCMFVEDQCLYVGYADGFVRLWSQSKLVREFRVHNGVVMTMTKEGDTIFTGGQDQTVFALDIRDGKTTALYRGTHGPIRALSTYGNKLMIATGNAIRVQTIDTGELLQRLCGHTLPIFSMLRDRNLLYSGSGDRKVFVWNLDTLWPIMEINTGHQGRVKSMCLSSQGVLFTGSSDRVIRKFDMRDAFGRYEAFAQQNNISPRPVINGGGGGGKLQRSMSSGGHHGGAMGNGGAPGGSLNAMPGSNAMSTIDLADMLPALPGSNKPLQQQQQQQQQEQFSMPPPSPKPVQPQQQTPPPKPSMPPPSRAQQPPPAQRSFPTMPNVQTVLVPVYSVNQPNEPPRAATLPANTLRSMQQQQQQQQQQPPPQQFQQPPQFHPPGPPPGPPGPPNSPPPIQNQLPPPQMPPPRPFAMSPPPMSPQPMSPGPPLGGPPSVPQKQRSGLTLATASMRELPQVMPEQSSSSSIDFDALDDDRQYGNLNVVQGSPQLDATPANFPGYRALPAVPGQVSPGAFPSLGAGGFFNNNAPAMLDDGQGSYSSLPAHAAGGNLW